MKLKTVLLVLPLMFSTLVFAEPNTSSPKEYNVEDVQSLEVPNGAKIIVNYKLDANSVLTCHSTGGIYVMGSVNEYGSELTTMLPITITNNPHLAFSPIILVDDPTTTKLTINNPSIGCYTYVTCNYEQRKVINSASTHYPMH